jgi:hypothetical protein
MADNTVERHEDMSPTGRLRLHAQDDGDICIQIVDERGRCAGVEFCSVGSGGGRSKRTIAALRQLFRAMSEDNASGERDDACGEFPGDVDRFPPVSEIAKATLEHSALQQENDQLREDLGDVTEKLIRLRLSRLQS